MEILIGMLIIGVVIALCRLWLSGSEPSTAINDSPSTSGATVFANPSNSWMLDQTIDGGNDSSSSSDTSDWQSSDASTSQDCSPDFGSDSSSNDCSCPADSSRCDSGGCSVDSGSFDVGSSN